jgi:hypothetical protein
LLRLKFPWIAEFYSDGGATIYHPYSGTLVALADPLASVMKWVDSAPLGLEVSWNGIADFNPELAKQLGHELALAEILDYLKDELGVVESVANNR